MTITHNKSLFSLHQRCGKITIFMTQYNLHVGLSSLVSYDNPTTVRELLVFDWCSGKVAPMATNVMKIDLLESDKNIGLKRN